MAAVDENEEFEFRLRAEKEHPTAAPAAASATPTPAATFEAKEAKKAGRDVSLGERMDASPVLGVTPSALETAATVGSSAVGGIAGGLAGLGHGAVSLAKGEGWDTAAKKAADTSEGVAGAMTYQPRLPQAKQNVQTINEVGGIIHKLAGDVGATVGADLAGNPSLGQLAGEIAPTVLTMGNPLKPMPKKAPVAGKDFSPLREFTPAEGERFDRQTSQGVQPTLGSVTRDPSQVRFEQQTAALPSGAPLHTRMVQNDKALADHIESLKDTPDLKGAKKVNETTAGEQVRKATEAQAAAKKAEITEKYEKARASGETKEMIDLDPIKRYLDDHKAEAIAVPKLAAVRAMVDDLETLNKASANGDAIIVHHGGTYKPGDPIKGHLYTSADQELAGSYTDMHYAEDGSVSSFTHDAKRAAPESLVKAEAKKLGIKNEEMGYTPASVFDKNLHDPAAVKQLIKNLSDKGYDHAVLKDRGFGINKDGDATVLFPQVKTSAIKEHQPGHVTIDQIENLRQRIGELAQGDGSVKKYMGDLRKGIDQMTEGKGGDLYKDARKARREYATQFEDNAGVANILDTKTGTPNDHKVAVENVWNKTVKGGSVEDLGNVLGSLRAAKGKQKAIATQSMKDMQAHTIDNLLDESFIDGSISVDKLRKGIDNLGADKVRMLLGDKAYGKLQDALRTAKDTKTVARRVPGSDTNANISNTVERLAAEHAQSVVTGILPAWMGKLVKNFTENSRIKADARARAEEVSDALTPHRAASQTIRDMADKTNSEHRGALMKEGAARTTAPAVVSTMSDRPQPQTAEDKRKERDKRYEVQ